MSSSASTAITALPTTERLVVRLGARIHPPPRQTDGRCRPGLIESQVFQRPHQFIDAIKGHRAQVPTGKNLPTQPRQLVISTCFDGNLKCPVFWRDVTHAPDISYQQPHFGQIASKRRTRGHHSSRRGPTQTSTKGTNHMLQNVRPMPAFVLEATSLGERVRDHRF